MNTKDGQSTIKTFYPHISLQTGYPVTGWLCSVCFENAQVKEQSWMLCKNHAMEFDHGYGKTIMEMAKEWKDNKIDTKSKKK